MIWSGRQPDFPPALFYEKYKIVPSGTAAGTIFLHYDTVHAGDFSACLIVTAYGLTDLPELF